MANSCTKFKKLEILKSESDVRERYRFYTPTIYSILRIIKDNISRPTNRSESLPPLTILCAALRFYATGSYYTVLGDCILISKASLCRCIDSVTTALVNQAPNFIKWPSEEGLEELKEHFYQVAGKKSLKLFAFIKFP